MFCHHQLSSVLLSLIVASLSVVLIVVVSVQDDAPHNKLDRLCFPLYLCTRPCHLAIAMFVITDNQSDARINGAASRLASYVLQESHHLYTIIIVRRPCCCWVVALVRGGGKISLAIGSLITMQRLWLNRPPIHVMAIPCRG